MTEKKITKKDRFNQLLAMESVKAIEGMEEFILHEIELLDRKRTPSGKDAVNAKENIEILEHIKGYLAEHNEQGFSCSELMKIVPAEMSVKEITLPRISNILNTASKNGNGVVRYEEKRKAYFKLA